MRTTLYKSIFSFLSLFSYSKHGCGLNILGSKTWPPDFDGLLPRNSRGVVEGPSYISPIALVFNFLAFFNSFTIFSTRSSNCFFFPFLYTRSLCFMIKQVSNFCLITLKQRRVSFDIMNVNELSSLISYYVLYPQFCTSNPTV